MYGKGGLTREQRVLRGRMAAQVLHSKVDSRLHTQPAREAFLAKFEAEVDPDGILPPSERRRRAESARKAHFTRLAYLSSLARAGRKAGRS